MKLVQDFLLLLPSLLILPVLSTHIDHLLRTSVDWSPRRQSHGGGAGLDFIPVLPRFRPQLCCVLGESYKSNHCFYILNFKRMLQDESCNICILETFQKSTKWCLACGKLDVSGWKIIFVEVTLSWDELDIVAPSTLITTWPFQGAEHSPKRTTHFSQFPEMLSSD